jgi:hypothetical protein
MHTERYQFDATRFNSLPDIEVASADMKAKGKLSLAFSALAPIFARHNMCDSWGISLLHNHWQVEDGELPIQDATRTDSPLEYETTPRQAPFTKSIGLRSLPRGIPTTPVSTPLNFQLNPMLRRQIACWFGTVSL